MRRFVFIALSIAIALSVQGCSGERSGGVSEATGQDGPATTLEPAALELPDDAPTGRNASMFLSRENRGETESAREARGEGTAPAQRAHDDVQEATPVEYVVRRGDTMFAISSRFYDTDVYHALLARYNSLSDASRIRPGDVLTVPPIAEFPYRLHRVVAGDNLLSLARRFYETAEYNEALLFADAIAEANGFMVIDRIATGSVLIVPHAHGSDHDVEAVGRGASPGAASQSGRWARPDQGGSAPGIAGGRGVTSTWLGGGRGGAAPAGVEKPVCKVDEPVCKVEEDTTGVVTVSGDRSHAERAGP